MNYYTPIGGYERWRFNLLDFLAEWVIPILAILFLFLTLMVMPIRYSMVQRECLELGYRDSSTTWGTFGQAYCITRSDQTDIVVPIEKARKEPR